MLPNRQKQCPSKYIDAGPIGEPGPDFSSHWSQNKAGVCLISKECSSLVEDIPHILRFCTALDPTRVKLKKFTHKYCMRAPPIIRELASSLCTTASPFFCQFLLDCSVLPPVIAATQSKGWEILDHLFHFSRIWVLTFIENV